MEIVLVHPEIPHNTGCAARLSAALGVPLHLVEPLGFSLEDRHLKRAGLDYWPQVDLTVHPDLPCALSLLERTPGRPLSRRLKLFTARGGRSLFESHFEPDDLLVFGRESSGLPQDLLDRDDLDHIYIPIRPGVRSLNLANTVCLALYTATVRAGLPLPSNSGSYRAHPLASADVWPHHIARQSD